MAHFDAQGNAEALSSALNKEQLKTGDKLKFTLDLPGGGRAGTAGSLAPKVVPSAALMKGGKKRGRLSLEVNGVALGQLASDISAQGGLCWMAELCGGEMIRVVK